MAGVLRTTANGIVAALLVRHSDLMAAGTLDSGKSGAGTLELPPLLLVGAGLIWVWGCWRHLSKRR